MLRGEKGITLVALIITIIILVILAAVSIAAVMNMKIVDYAVNGAQNYAKAGVQENTVIKQATDTLEETIGNITDIQNE